MNKNKNAFLKIFLIILTLALIIAAIFYLVKKETIFEKTQIRIGKNILNVEVADNLTKRATGLSFRESIGENEGMLFVFEEPIEAKFWMKNMKFSIDIIWIDENLKVVGIEKNISPDTYPQEFKSPGKIKYAIEVNAGWTDSHKIKKGDKLIFFEEKYKKKYEGK